MLSGLANSSSRAVGHPSEPTFASALRRASGIVTSCRWHTDEHSDELPERPARSWTPAAANLLASHLLSSDGRQPAAESKGSAVSRAARQPAAGEPRSGARRHGVKALAAVALGAGLLLSGCAAGQISQTAQEVAAIDGGNATVGDIGVRNALLATPDAANYATGSNVKLLMVLSNDGLSADTLTSISTPAASSVKLSGSITVPAQSLVTISADSTATATLTGSTRPLCYGKSIPLTFSFAQAGQLTVNVPIQTPAERTGGRDTINIQPPELTPLWLTDEATSTGASAGSASVTAAASQSRGASAAPPTACNG